MGGPPRYCAFRRATGSDRGALQVQTAFNIREWGGRRKQKAVRGPESRSKRMRCLFGNWDNLEHPRGLEGRYRLPFGPAATVAIAC